MRIAALYAIEDEIRGRDADERRAVQARANKPLVDKLGTWLKQQLARVSKGSEIAKEIRYGLNHWAGPLPLPRRWPHRDRLRIPSSAQCGRLR